MKKLLVSCVSAAILLTSVPAVAGCGEADIACFRRGFLERGQKIDSLGREVMQLNALLKSKDEQIDTTQVALNSLKASLDSTSLAVKAGERKWHESPVLWFGVGVTAGILVVLVSAVALSQVH